MTGEFEIGNLPPPFKVAVLLASYNGEKFISIQLSSILNQEGCDVKIFVSDDHSTDSTREILSDFAKRHPGRICISETKSRSNSAGANFYELIDKTNCSEFDYVAFSDQDDIWEDNHLSSALSLLGTLGCDGVSSNVLAIYSDGDEKLYRKNQPQKKYDFLFESPGPGCTFVLTQRLFRYVADVFSKHSEIVRSVFHHDWLIYAVARSARFRWFIRDEPLVRYRQHCNNETGARIGLKSLYVRFKKVYSGWYANQIHSVALVVDANRVMEGDKVLGCLVRRRNSVFLLMYFYQTRRLGKDCLLFVLFVLVGWIK